MLEGDFIYLLAFLVFEEISAKVGAESSTNASLIRMMNFMDILGKLASLTASDLSSANWSWYFFWVPKRIDSVDCINPWDISEFGLSISSGSLGETTLETSASVVWGFEISDSVINDSALDTSFFFSYSADVNFSSELSFLVIYHMPIALKTAAIPAPKVILIILFSFS